MLTIGFTNKFYTLWDVTEERINHGNGRISVITHFNYIKNISFDKEVALSKYPNIPFDDTLKGHTTSWSSTKEIWDNVDTYRFGKYKYSKITDADIKYTAWYWDQIYGDHKDYVTEVLKRNGYEIRKWESGNEYLMSPEALENERLENLRRQEELNILEAHTPLEVTFEVNPDYEGYCRIENTIYHFQEVKENYYNGFNYYLPMINGKQKRIKNKNLIIKEYTYNVNENGLINVEILSFEIIK